ncbi:MAG: hypothetical protein HY855_24405 [Burkholderiales bacterium]|nr:hypothetical protein [Burkholderiales bacterium]
MKFLLMVLVLGFGLWLVLKRAGGARMPPPPKQPPGPQSMAECAHCGLHLPVADAVVDGTRVYCSDAHRLLGPRRAGPP